MREKNGMINTEIARPDQRCYVRRPHRRHVILWSQANEETAAKMREKYLNHGKGCKTRARAIEDRLKVCADSKPICGSSPDAPPNNRIVSITSGSRALGKVGVL